MEECVGGVWGEVSGRKEFEWFDGCPSSCNRAARDPELAMNVTIKLPDELVNEARHRAVARSQSLSQWVAELMRTEIARRHPDRKTLSDRLGDPATAHRDFALPDRKSEVERPVSFP